MKNLIALAAFASSTAFAQTAATVPTIGLSCVVPSQGSQTAITVKVELAPQESVDFITMTLSDSGVETTLFTQLDKGSLESGLKSGSFGTMVLTENASQENGMVKGAGIFSINKEADGTFSGVLAAIGNIYPLSCK